MISIKPNESDKYSKLTEIYTEVLNRHAPLKKKVIRGNNAPFMTKELRKAIMSKSKAKNNYLKWKSRENFLAYKKAKNRCNTLIHKEPKETISKG